MKLSGEPPDEITHAWEDVKAMFNGGTRKRLTPNSNIHCISVDNAGLTSFNKQSLPSPHVTATRSMISQTISSMSTTHQQIPEEPMTEPWNQTLVSNSMMNPQKRNLCILPLFPWLSEKAVIRIPCK
ncbi:hypothetical protein QAD02_003563 [Eretmocerus hayati]|uniref:Uncharacterized protein n=1 Tax=Eretmocerus hayati TaxID=131215 RepID=A0ACC2NPQ5_9HYME|nr:hypothetical protein QAD02_003563 [Eretmocerus hayati]